MLAHLIAEPELVGETAVDATLAVGPPDSKLAAQLAYEAALLLDEEWWRPRPQPTATGAELMA